MILSHICCSVDSHYFLQKLKKDYPTQDIVGFFYNPNIHPYSEYYLRLIEVRRSCKMLGIRLIEGEYNYKEWLNLIEGYESAPEKGKRCVVCFDDRYEKSASLAMEIGATYLTTTLLMSPKKSHAQLKAEGEKVEKNFDVNFLFVDYRPKGGVNDQLALANKDQLYKQDYCGCLFALEEQRLDQNVFLDEFISSIDNTLMPASIDEKVKFYEKRIEIEDEGNEYTIVKKRFLNYRLLSAFFKIDKQIVPSYVLPYSKTNRKLTKSKVIKKDEKIAYLSRDDIKVIPLSFYNLLASKQYESAHDLLFKEKCFDEEIEIRSKIVDGYDLSATVVIDDENFENMENKKTELYLNSVTYNDTKEIFV